MGVSVNNLSVIPSSTEPTVVTARTTRSTTSERFAIRALWIAVVLIHTMCGAYYAFLALLYFALPATLAGDHMRAFGLVIGLNKLPVLVVFFAICSMLHAVLLLEMLAVSVHRRSLVYYSNIDLNSLTKSARSLRHRITRSALSQVRVLPKQPWELTRRPTGRLGSTWDRWFGFAGYFGVGGKHFTLLFIVRETLEATLQSIQAYQLSKFVPRRWLNRSAITIVAVSCWSTPAIHRLMAQSPRVELLLCLLVDIILDIASSIGVPVALGAIYLGDYDWSITNFAYTKWGDQVWIANLTSEFKQLFIQNWFDFGMRALFAIATLMSLNDVKLLVMSNTAHPGSSCGVSNCVFNVRTSTIPRQERFEKLIHGALIVWGAVILGLHIESVTRPAADPTDCLVAVFPWLARSPTCATISIDCLAHEGMTGTAAELEKLWSGLDPQAVSILILSNCPELHIPPSIQSFSELKSLNIGFSTVKEWSAAAAMTRHHHLELRQLWFHTTNMTAACDPSSSLPPGLLSHDFPTTLGTVFSAGVALDKLPSNLHEIWPRGLSLLLLMSDISVVPGVLSRLDPVRVLLWGNNLRRVPASLFENPSLRWLDIAWNPIDNLPKQASPSPALKEISMMGTNISALPTWMQVEFFRTRVKVKAAMTPFCAQLEGAVDSNRVALAARYCSA